MAVSIGSLLGSYEVTALLGKGGCGEVYRARDRKLKREVAIKILPDEFSRDPDRVSRFQREAEVLAQLNHPNIGAIYDLAASQQAQVLVLELVDGETLADRIARGPIGIEEAIAIAKQIAAALEAAHEKGVIHRDLKPANIKITPDGRVKVLDFGLAKVRQATAASSLSNSPTLLSASAPGVILGTAAYMSPEQAKGKDADEAADIWAFGCVLYEMLTGQRVFAGDSIGEIFAGILKTEVDWSRLPADAPAGIRRLLRRCLHKDANRRFKHAGDVYLELDEAMSEPLAEMPARVDVKGGTFVWKAVTAVLVILFAIAATLLLVQRPAALPELHLDIVTPATSRLFQFALSPDGRRLAFAASNGANTSLWLRSLDQDESQPLPGTEDAALPFWSPDGRSLGFFVGTKLERMDIGAGAATVLADAVQPSGGTWNNEGVILFSNGSGIFRIPASGGRSVAVTQLAPGNIAQRYPNFLPDGHSFLYIVTGGSDGGIWLGALDGTPAKRITSERSTAQFVTPDRIVFVQQGSTLVAQRWDAGRRAPVGEPEVIANGVGWSSVTGFAALSTGNGRIVYRTGASDQRRLIWYDRSGNAVSSVGDSDVNSLTAPELSPDGRRVAVDRTVARNRDVWLMDVMHGGLTRFTFDAAADGFPLWSPDGTQIAFESQRNAGNSWDIYLKPSNNTSPEKPLVEQPFSQWPLDWSQDGRFLVYHDQSKGLGHLMALPMTGDDRRPFVVTDASVDPSVEERAAAFSPDSKWVAYDTNESGRFEIVVQSFPIPSSKSQVSTTGGAQPRWSADGKEIYFVAPDRKLMAASVHSAAGSFEVSPPIPLFQTRVPNSSAADDVKQQYAVSRDGRFLINTVEESAAKPITLILNWRPK